MKFLNGESAARVTVRTVVAGLIVRGVRGFGFSPTVAAAVPAFGRGAGAAALVSFAGGFLVAALLPDEERAAAGAAALAPPALLLAAVPALFPAVALVAVGALRVPELLAVAFAGCLVSAVLADLPGALGFAGFLAGAVFAAFVTEALVVVFAAFVVDPRLVPADAAMARLCVLTFGIPRRTQA
jgi:hypothetical protein